MPDDSAAALTRAWFERVWNQGDADAIDHYLSPGCMAYAGDERGCDMQGPEAFRQFHQRFLDAFPDIHFTLHEVIEQGDTAACRWTARGTHTGHGLGMPPSGRAVTIDGMSMVRIEGGRATEVWNAFDRTTLAIACRLVVPVG